MGHKCIAVIERKVLIIALDFTNPNDYTPTRLAYFVRYKHIDLYMQILFE